MRSISCAFTVDVWHLCAKLLLLTQQSNSKMTFYVNISMHADDVELFYYSYEVCTQLNNNISNAAPQQINKTDVQLLLAFAQLSDARAVHSYFSAIIARKVDEDDFVLLHNLQLSAIYDEFASEVSMLHDAYAETDEYSEVENDIINDTYDEDALLVGITETQDNACVYMSNEQATLLGRAQLSEATDMFVRGASKQDILNKLHDAYSTRIAFIASL